MPDQAPPAKVRKRGPCPLDFLRRSYCLGPAMRLDYANHFGPRRNGWPVKSNRVVFGGCEMNKPNELNLNVEELEERIAPGCVDPGVQGGENPDDAAGEQGIQADEGGD